MLLCGLSGSLPVLVLCRMIQGIGAAAVVTLIGLWKKGSFE
jgi:MFS family permease